MTEIKPNEPQKEALEGLRGSQDTRAVSVMPPGIGKTYLTALHAKELGAKTVLTIAHRREILDQHYDSYRNVFAENPEESFGFVDGTRREYGCRFVFASIQTISRPANLQRLLEAHQNHFDYVVVDEYHHAAAKTWSYVLEQLKGKFGYLVGITATPYRLDGKDALVHVGGNVVFEMDLKTAITKGYLAPFRYYAYFDDVNYDKIQWQGMNYNQKQLDKAYSIDARDMRIIREYKELEMHRKQTLVFCVSIKHAERMAVKFTSAGVKSGVITSRVSYRDRADRIKEFREGKLRALFTRDIFNEGVDFPEVECIIFLRPTVSKTIFMQQLGRGLRKKEGKNHVVVMDFIGNFRKNFEISKMMEKLGAEQRDPEEKPTFEYNLSTVHFQKELVDFWEEQAGKNTYVKQTIVQAYKNLKQKLKRSPTRTEMYKNTGYNISFYFGTYAEMLRQAGEPEWYVKAIESPKPVEQSQIDGYYQYLKKTRRKIPS